MKKRHSERSTQLVGSGTRPARLLIEMCLVNVDV